MNWRQNYHQSKYMTAVQIFLLVLIIVGVVLLFTQKSWVPKLTSAILSTETGQKLFPPIKK